MIGRELVSILIQEMILVYNNRSELLAPLVFGESRLQQAIGYWTVQKLLPRLLHESIRHFTYQERLTRNYRMSTDCTPGMRVVDKVAIRAGVDPEELPPLYDAIDPDAIAIVFQNDSAQLVFEYAGYTIRITDENRIQVESSKKKSGSK